MRRPDGWAVGPGWFAAWAERGDEAVTFTAVPGGDGSPLAVDVLVVDEFGESAMAQLSVGACVALCEQINLILRGEQ